VLGDLTMAFLLSHIDLHGAFGRSDKVAACAYVFAMSTSKFHGEVTRFQEGARCVTARLPGTLCRQA